ncbi:apoptosis regulator BAX-like [Erythrolamprus reginae]|uniref:apoptosis regulator BAX-like n=1 Tax=Erythrolamprus reginae TaxID=121349 RepID=UPI00396CFA05
MAAEESGRNRPMAPVASPADSRLSDSISCILRIGKALLWGFIKTLWQRFAPSSPHPASLEQYGRANGEDEQDAAQVHSLQDHMLHILQELRSNEDITRMAQSVTSQNLFHVLAEVSEEMFATGVNWGRIVVFFFFTFEVCRQSGVFSDVMDWVMNFLKDRLAHWIQGQGGWSGLLNFFPS